MRRRCAARTATARGEPAVFARSNNAIMNIGEASVVKHRRNRKGVTLVEVLISLVILLIVFMGLIQASLVSVNTNMRNAIRDGAASLASEYMTRARATPIDTLVVGAPICGLTYVAPPLIVTRQVRNFPLQYSVTTTSCFTDASKNSALVTVLVTYKYPGDVPPPPGAEPSTTTNAIVTRQ